MTTRQLMREALDLADELDRYGMDCMKQKNRDAFGLPEEPPEEDWKSARWLGALLLLALFLWGTLFAWLLTRI